VEALAKALSGKTLTVYEATKAALAAGYRSASPELRKMVVHPSGARISHA
jgi:hypothetical protein